MKKLIFCLSLVALLCTAKASISFADGFVFEPNGNTSVNDTFSSQLTVNDVIKGNEIANYQEAITQLENAQIELRTKLTTLKTQYSEIEQRYENVKVERKTKKNEIKKAEKSIQNIEKLKDKINMQIPSVQ